jgi:Cellulose binding domain
MQDERARREPWARPRLRCGLALAAALAGGCATGVDVTEDELAAICSEPGTTCGGGAGAAVGSAGGGSSSTGGSSSGGSLGANGGTGTANGGSFSNGGSSSSTGGTGNGASGSGGTGSGGTLAEGDCLPTSDLSILYRARETNASAQEPSMVLSVQNSAGMPFDLSTLTIRYWFTADGYSNFIPAVDYASLNGQGDIKSSISVTFGEASGSNYAQMSFASGAGSVDASGVRELQLRFHADGYQPLNQANDFSFLGSAGEAATPNPNVTPYLSGEQVGGCIPSP